MTPQPITALAALRPGDRIRIVLTDGTVQDHVVDEVNGTTVTTHAPVAYAMGGVVSKYTAEGDDRIPAVLGGCRHGSEGFDPDPDDLTRAQLVEMDPMLSAVGEALDEWLHMHHGILSSHHNAGHFWTLLHEHGYRIVPNEPMPDLADIMPAATD